MTNYDVAVGVNGVTVNVRTERDGVVKPGLYVFNDMPKALAFIAENYEAIRAERDDKRKQSLVAISDAGVYVEKTES